MKRPPCILNVFAGAGGLALGFEQAGFAVAAAIEPDPVHAATFKRNFAKTPVHCCPVDVATLKSLGERDFDVVAGGLPSSAFSNGGRRDPDDDRRHLLDRFVEIVLGVQPEAFALEAVPGILAPQNASIVRRAMKALSSRGYATPQIWHLDAADFAVPQTRKRVWLVGTRDGLPTPKTPMRTVIPQHRRPAGLPVLPREGLDAGPTVWDAIGDLPDPQEHFELRTADRRRLESWPGPSPWAAALRCGNQIGYSPAREVDPHLLTASQATRHTMASALRYAQTAPGSAEPVSRFYRLHPDGLSRTLRAGTGRDRGAFTGARPIHPTQPRVITVREGARLQGFPDWFGFNATKWHGFHQVGASAPPPVARVVAEALVEALRFEPSTAHSSFEPDDTLLFLDLTSAARRMGATAMPQPRRRGAGTRPRPRRTNPDRPQLALLKEEPGD